MRRRSSLLAAALCVLALACWSQVRPAAVRAQEKDQAASQQQTTEQKAESTRKAPRGRLPRYYGQIGLTREQREKIYTIQAKYRAQIEELLKQIEELRAKEQQEIEAVLRPEQKQLLSRLQEEARKRRASRRRSSSGR